MSRSGWIGSLILFLALISTIGGLSAWKYDSIQESNKASSNQPEPMESVSVAVAEDREHHPSMTSIGTVLALRSVTLRNELAGTLKQVNLIPGQIVDEGTLLVALDVSVEEAELKAMQAEAQLAETTLSRMQFLTKNLAASQEELDRARAEREVALAQIDRIKAIISKKKIHAPFRARVGLSDIHPGQYLNEGTQLTTLQGVDDNVHVDFSVPQWVAEDLKNGDKVEILGNTDSSPSSAEIVAVDARIDPETRNAMVRAKIKSSVNTPAPGSSLTVRVPIAAPINAVSIPVSSLRRGPGGDHVFVIEKDGDGKNRAHIRQVESGEMIKDEVLILSGLAEGELVAASGSFKLNDSSLVSIISDLRTDSRNKR